MKTIYQTIKAIAAPIVKSYLTDVTKHDRKACAEMQAGDVSFWAPYKSGSHLVRCIVREDTATEYGAHAVRQRLLHFEACQKIYPGLQWYMLESTNGPYGHVVTVEPQFILDTFQRRIQAMERVIESV